jgi:ring-1,2-phenylacetyl-CoA epoxidase subunit PaaC
MTWENLNAETALKDEAYCTALKDLLYQLADDDLIIGHRASEWLGLAPEIEEDVAFSSISQDEVGHATFYYGLLSHLGEGTPDALAFDRAADVRRNAVMLERENGDWAHTIVRHYFYDVFEDVRLRALERSSYVPLRQGAAKIRREEYYHLIHFDLWFQRLLKAGGEGRERMLRAIDALWGDVAGLFDLGPHAEELLAFDILPATAADLRSAWQQRVEAALASTGVAVPNSESGEAADRAHHTEALRTLLATMGEVHNIDKLAVW